MSDDGKRVSTTTPSRRRLLVPGALLVACAAIAAAPVPAPAGTNVPPTVRITSPPDCGLVDPQGGQFQVAIEAVADDPDGSIVAVRFYSWFGTLCSVDSFPPYVANCPMAILVEGHAPRLATAGAGADPSRLHMGGECGCSFGSFQPETQLIAVAVDNEGATTSSDTVRVRPDWSVPVHGSSVAVADPGFDASALADGAQATGPGTIGGWTFVGTAGAAMGVLNPTAASYPGAAGNGTPPGASGANVAFLAVPAGTADAAAASQDLPDTLRHWSRYWIQLAVGSPLDAPPGALSPFEGAIVELWAGTTVIAEATCSAVWTAGEFFDLTGSAVTDLLPAELIGRPLSIHVRLDGGEEARSVQFDRVRLLRESYRAPGVPVEPMPIGLHARAIPNPAVGGGTIEFSLDRGELVTLTLFDPTGRAVGPRASRWLPPGPQRIPLPADLAPGLYFARLDAGARSQMVRLVRLER